MKSFVTQKSFDRSIATFAVLISTLAAAPVIHAATLYTTPSQAGERFNPGNTDLVTFASVFFPIDSAQTTLDLTDLLFGVRRDYDANGFAIPVNVGTYVAEMTFNGTNYGAGNVINTGNITLQAEARPAGSTATAFTQNVLVTYNETTPVRPQLTLEKQSFAGLGGVYVGLRFFGANGASQVNGFRNAQAPASPLASLNSYFQYNTATSAFDNTPRTFSLQTPQRNYFNVSVGGNLLPAVVPEAGTVLLFAGALPVIGAVMARRRKAG